MVKLCRIARVDGASQEKRIICKLDVSMVIRGSFRNHAHMTACFVLWHVQDTQARCSSLARRQFCVWSGARDCAQSPVADTTEVYLVEAEVVRRRVGQHGQEPGTGARTEITAPK